MAEPIKSRIRKAAEKRGIQPKVNTRAIVRCKLPGMDAEIELEHRELVRRAMAAQVARRVMELVDHHHVTESGRRIKLDEQWRDVYADPSPDVRIMAPAQRGKTLYEIVKTFSRMSLGLACGWVMPKYGKIQELVRGKLDPTIRNTPFYRDNMKGGDTMQFKEFGDYGRLYLVTSNSESELTSFSADCMTIDERDFCNNVMLPMYPSRMNASPYKLTDEISTPTVEGTLASRGARGVDNIHSEFLKGDQRRWWTSCNNCGHEQIIDWYKHVVDIKTDQGGRIMDFAVRDVQWEPGGPMDIRPVCEACRRPMDRLGPGRWRSSNPGKMTRSYWIEALATVMGPTLAQMHAKFTDAIGNPSKMQQFHNMDLGRPYAGGIMRFTDDLFKLCEGGYRMLERCDGPCTIGIDVNRPWLDVQISKWVDGKQIKVYAGKIDGDEETICDLIKRFGVTGGVMDTHPEQKFSQKVQAVAMERHRVPIVRCKYATNEQGKMIVVSEAGETKLDAPRLITVNRTVCIDSVYETMQTASVQWFDNWREACNGDLPDEFRNPVRKLVTNEAGNHRFVWAGEPDHQLHAAVYDWLAGEVLGMKVKLDYSKITPVVSTVVHQSAPEPRTASDSQLTGMIGFMR